MPLQAAGACSGAVSAATTRNLRRREGQTGSCRAQLCAPSIRIQGGRPRSPEPRAEPSDLHVALFVIVVVTVVELVGSFRPGGREIPVREERETWGPEGMSYYETTRSYRSSLGKTRGSEVTSLPMRMR